MKRIELGGEWEVRARDHYKVLPANDERTLNWIPATVPGTIHTDLMAQNIIPDPYYRMNENNVQWIDGVQWLYRRSFMVDDEILKEKEIVLAAEGLDTYASIAINGKNAGTAENMFVGHRFSIKRLLKKGENTIEVLFDSPVKRSLTLEKKHGRLQVALEPHRVYVRKAQYSFSWDWGPKLITAGIWRPIAIEASSGPALRNPFVKTVSLKGKSATIEVSVDIERLSAPVDVEVNIEGEYFAERIVKRTSSSSLRFRMKIDHPNLWWPNGFGRQPLYTATFTLKNGSTPQSSVATAFGIRTIELQQDKDAEGRSFVVVVNGQKIFCKGADWIPSDNFIPRITDTKYERLLTMARDANMNMIRVWGGGIYEQDAFYNLCDRLGLLVWQDFMFACGEYPQTDWFLRSVKDEAEKAVTRLRNHPSIAVWCGNNECEWLFCTGNPGKTPDDMTGAVIFRKVLPGVVKNLDGSRPYWRSSPFGIGFPNNESDGNHHQWHVWSFWKDYKEYENCNARFVTEFGFQAPATIRTWEECTLPADRLPQHPVIEHHNKQVEGQERLFRFQAGHYIVGTEFNDFVYRGQLVQANALKTAVEHWRRRKFNTAGALFWQLNDCWPVSSWSVIDSSLRPKASYYYAKRFFSSVLVSLKRNGDTMEIWGTNDAPQPVEAVLDAAVLSLKGEKHALLNRTIVLKANNSALIDRIPIPDRGRNAAVEWYIHACLSKDNAVISENRYFFAEPKQLNLTQPAFQWSVVGNGGGRFRVQIVADRFAKDACIDIEGVEARLNDNYFDMEGGTAKNVECTVPDGAIVTERNVKIVSLWNS